uniref:Fructose-bisphosphate aldolase n=2 Tax=Amorphochlora amoebiformis TaxID=1561963 RepID=A0A7S0DFR7_9EUKA|mmetsp:Transcript_26007/g.41202  ORF Transcript_26007/g.41202 Transcript_26007/m.41202 type:complete len:319 (+) Transcript_26007:104-1060(+)
MSESKTNNALKRLKAICGHVFTKENKYAQELIATAQRIATPGKGILAADESIGTIGKRFKAINVPNTRENRRAYRYLLSSTKGLGKHISGVILFEESLFETMADGSDLVDGFKKEGILLGIKVDKGTRHLPGTDGELYTQGLTDLDKRCKKYYEFGARFAKWRAVVKILDKVGPSLNAINETAHSLARYAAICQANGLAPIVEPEILMDGKHDLATAQKWTEKVISTCYEALRLQGVLLEGTLLKPNMVLPGAQCDKKYGPADCAAATVTALQRSVPVAVPGITVTTEPSNTYRYPYIYIYINITKCICISDRMMMTT